MVPCFGNGKKVADAKTFAALNTKEVTRSYEQPDGSTVTVKYYADANGNIASAPYYDKDGNRLIVDGSEIGDVYAYKAKDGVVSLQKAFNSISRSNSWDYASVKVSVDDNTLDLTEGTLMISSIQRSVPLHSPYQKTTLHCTVVSTTLR